MIEPSLVCAHQRRLVSYVMIMSTLKQIAKSKEQRTHGIEHNITAKSKEQRAKSKEQTNVKERKSGNGKWEDTGCQVH